MSPSLIDFGRRYMLHGTLASLLSIGIGYICVLRFLSYPTFSHLQVAWVGGLLPSQSGRAKCACLGWCLAIENRDEADYLPSNLGVSEMHITNQ